MNIRTMTQHAMLASLYIVFTIFPPFNAIAYGPVQFRISEALLMFVLVRKDFVYGLVIGTFFANILGTLGGSFALIDAFVGSVVSLLACVWMIKVKRVGVAILAPILLNGLYLGLFLPFVFALPFTWPTILGIAGSVMVGEAAVLVVLGIPLYLVLLRHRALRRLLGIAHD
jgi:uncharacterized membrane protein